MIDKIVNEIIDNCQLFNDEFTAKEHMYIKDKIKEYAEFYAKNVLIMQLII